MSITDKSKIVIIGAGNVGEAVCYTLMVRRQASEIVLVDINGDRAEGSALDIVHGTAFFHQVKVRNGGYEDCADAQIIILTAGVAGWTWPKPMFPLPGTLPAGLCSMLSIPFWWWCPIL